MKRAEFIVIAFVVGFICGAAFTLAYMGGNNPDPRPFHPVTMKA